MNAGATRGSELALRRRWSGIKIKTMRAELQQSNARIRVYQMVLSNHPEGTTREVLQDIERNMLLELEYANDLEGMIELLIGAHKALRPTRNQESGTGY